MLRLAPAALGADARQDRGGRRHGWAVTPNRLRGQVTSIYLLMINLIGLGLGPFLVALCTDYVFHDELKVGASLGIVGVLAALAGAACLWFAARPYRALLRIATS